MTRFTKQNLKQNHIVYYFGNKIKDLRLTTENHL